MILIITLIYFIKINKDDDIITNDKNETREMQIVREITENINKEVEPTIDFTDYEKDQEDKAIISYEELLNKTKPYDLDHFTVKKDKEMKIEVRVISYAEEEAFLKTLKQLQSNLT